MSHISLSLSRASWLMEGLPPPTLRNLAGDDEGPVSSSPVLTRVVDTTPPGGDEDSGGELADSPPPTTVAPLADVARTLTMPS